MSELTWSATYKWVITDWGEQGGSASLVHSETFSLGGHKWWVHYRGLRSSTSQLNLSRFRHSTQPLTPRHPLHPRLKHPQNTPCPARSACIELTGGRVF